jgi:hypothetical protein
MKDDCIMTYRAHLDQLVTACTEKGKVYLAAKRIHGPHSPHVHHLKREWEQAEDDFETCLDLVMSNKVRLNDAVRPMPAGKLQSPHSS